MLKKKLNIKGLRKKVLKLEYEQKLMSANHLGEGNVIQSLTKSGGPSNITSLQNLNYRILILRNAPLDDSLLKGKGADEGAEAVVTRVFSKCIKKNILKKIINTNDLNACWLHCKYIYWIAPEATSLRDQFVHLNMLKSYIRAEPKDAFLGCLLESVSVNHNELKNNKVINYRYYYPSQILSLCDSMDKTAMLSGNKPTGLEVLGQLLQTIESSINSMSTILALKNMAQPVKDPK